MRANQHVWTVSIGVDTAAPVEAELDGGSSWRPILPAAAEAKHRVDDGFDEREEVG